MINRNRTTAVRGTRLAIRKGPRSPLYEAELVAEAFRERVLHTEDSSKDRERLEDRDPNWECR
jgi:hypothetical protein